MIVLDASAAVDLLASPGPRGDWVAERVRGAADLAAPHLLDIEVAHALRRLAQQGSIEEESAEQALADFARLDIARYPHRRLLERIWQLRRLLSAYDAAYIALAEALDAPVVTTDAHLARSRGHAAHVVGWQPASA